MKFEKLFAQYQTARKLQSELIEKLNEAGGVVSLQFSAMLFNAQKDVTRAQNKVRNAYRDGKITLEQYKQVFG